MTLTFQKYLIKNKNLVGKQCIKLTGPVFTYLLRKLTRTNNPEVSRFRYVLVLGELAFVEGAVRPRVFSDPVELVRFELAGVDGARRELHRALSVHLVRRPLAAVRRPVGRHVRPGAAPLRHGRRADDVLAIWWPVHVPRSLRVSPIAKSLLLSSFV